MHILLAIADLTIRIRPVFVRKGNYLQWETGVYLSSWIHHLLHMY